MLVFGKHMWPSTSKNIGLLAQISFILCQLLMCSGKSELSTCNCTNAYCLKISIYVNIQYIVAALMFIMFFSCIKELKTFWRWATSVLGRQFYLLHFCSCFYYLALTYSDVACDVKRIYIAGSLPSLTVEGGARVRWAFSVALQWNAKNVVYEWVVYVTLVLVVTIYVNESLS